MTGRHLHFPSDPLNIDFDYGRIEILLHHNALGKHWIPICGFDSYESSDIIWDTSKCVTEHLLNNVTRCICPISGTYVVLLEQQKLLSENAGQAQGSVLLVITSCLCFIQASTTFIVLVPLLYKHKCAVTFLKMQFCTAIATLSGTMIVGFSQQIPYKWNNILTCAIGAIFLLATSSLIGIILLISFGLSQQQHLQLHLQQQQHHHPHHHHQQVYRKGSGGGGGISSNNSTTTTNNNYYGGSSSSRSISPPSTATATLNSGSFLGLSQASLVVAAGLKCSITFSWILPTLYCIITWLIRHVMRTHSSTWWLKFGTVEAGLMLVNQALLSVIFYSVYVLLVRRTVLAPKALDQKFAFASTTTRRVGLLFRLGILYTLYLLVVSSYLTYLNYKTISLEYLTGALQFLMGSAVLISFAIHPEKTPKPLNRKAGGNIHNLNVDQTSTGGGGLPDGTCCPSAAIMAHQISGSGDAAAAAAALFPDMDLAAPGSSPHQQQQQLPAGGHNKHIPLNPHISAYNHQALLSLPSGALHHQQQQLMQCQDFRLDAMECDVRPMATERSPLALAVEASRFSTVRDISTLESPSSAGQASCQPEARLEASTTPNGSSSSSNMLDRITDDLNFLLNGSEDMMTFTPSHIYGGVGSGPSSKQKLPTIQETMVGLSEEFEMRAGDQVEDDHKANQTGGGPVVD